VDWARGGEAHHAEAAERPACSGVCPPGQTLKFSPTLIWTYPDGARQLRRGAPRRRAPNPPLQSLVNQCFSQTFEQLFSNEKEP